MRIAAQLVLTFLLNASWQVALIALFATVCDWLLRGTAARYRHALWVCALLLCIGLSALSCAPLIKPLLISKQPPAERNSEPIVISRILSADVEPIETPLARTQVTIEPARQSFWTSHLRIDQKLAGVLLTLYAMLIALRGANLFRAWKRTRTIISTAYEFRFPDPVPAIIQKCQAAIGVSRVRILCSSLVPVPITVGIMRPLIILPEVLLREVDPDLLMSAIGHELVHVARRDYLLNLIYEFIYLPLSFHPAAALVRRRIKQTRELCCDELVATRLLHPEIYARSLVRLIGSVPITRRLAANTTIGIAESDNLEVRIMSLLRTTKFTPRRRTFLLIAALLLLAVPCVAATSFGLTLDIARQEPSQAPQSSGQKLERQEQERAREGLKRAHEELKRAERELNAQKQVAPKSQLPEIENSLREVQKALEEYDRQRPDAERRLREVQQNLAEHDRIVQEQQNREATQKRVEEMRAALEQYEKTRPADEARMKEVREKIAELERLYTPEREREVQERIAEMQKLEGDRKATLIYRVEAEYPADAREKKIRGSVVLGLTIDHDGIPQNIQVKKPLYPSLDQAAIEAIRKWRFEPAMKDGQPVSMFITVEVNFNDYQNADREAQEKREAAERESKGEFPIREMRMRRDREQQGPEERARKQAELTKGAVISMDRAIQIAVSQVPGKVLACSLGRDGDKLFYHLVIINTEGDKSSTTYVWLSAIDGQILKTEKEERRE